MLTRFNSDRFIYGTGIDMGIQFLLSASPPTKVITNLGLGYLKKILVSYSRSV